METTLELLDDSFILGVPITKIDVQKRIVGGFATLDNIDKAKDILDYNASKEAFSEWPGNVREMHDKKAVGRAVDIKDDVYEDPETGKRYNGIWVEAKISKGAEDTWQKCVDGTLAGFSVGGATLEKQRELVKSDDGSDIPVWRITKYKLNELSLVDNPCNGLATISLVKSVDGILEETDVLEKAGLGKPMPAQEPQAPEPVDTDMPDIQAVIKALTAWRDKEATEGDDHDLAFISTLIQQLKERVFRGDPGEHGNDAAIFGDNKNQSAATVPMKQAKPVTNTAKVQKDADGDTDAGAEDTAEDADESTHPIVAYPIQHLATARKHLRAFHGHAAGKGHMRLADHAHNLMMQTDDLHKAAGMMDGMMQEDMCKSADHDSAYELEGKILQDNKISAIPDIEKLDDQNQSLIKKFVGFLLGDKNDTTSEEQVEKDGDETEMDETMLKEVLTAALEPLTKDSDVKFGQVGESLVKVAEALEKLAKTEDLDELKKSVEESLAEVVGRVETLENSGAMQKSADDAGTEEKIEKSEGFWSGSLVPEFVQAKYKAGR